MQRFWYKQTNKLNLWNENFEKGKYENSSDDNKTEFMACVKWWKLYEWPERKYGAYLNRIELLECVIRHRVVCSLLIAQCSLLGSHTYHCVCEIHFQSQFWMHKMKWNRIALVGNLKFRVHRTLCAFVKYSRNTWAFFRLHM